MAGRGFIERSLDRLLEADARALGGERSAAREGWLQQTDGRVKIGALVALLLGIAFSRSLPAIAAVAEGQNALARDQAVLDDPVERAADALLGAGGAESGIDRDLAVASASFDPAAQGGHVGAADRDLCHVEHGAV